MELNHDLIKQDIQAVKDFFVKFVASFGPSQKKVGDKPVGFFEERYIRFRLHLTDMGPVKWVKSIIVIIGAIVFYFVLFRHSDPAFMAITVFLFVLFYAWVWKPELSKEADDKKAGWDQYAASASKAVFGMFKQEEKKK